MRRAIGNVCERNAVLLISFSSFCLLVLKSVSSQSNIVPSPSSGESINCSNWTAAYEYLNPNCTAPSPSFDLKEERNTNCTLYFRWNTSYVSFDDEKYIGEYTCDGCNQAFVKSINDTSIQGYSLVLEETPENNPECCTDKKSALYENPCRCLPPRSKFKTATPMTHAPSPIPAVNISNYTNASLSSSPSPSLKLSSPSPSSLPSSQLSFIDYSHPNYTNWTAKLILNGTYECIPCKIEEDKTRTEMNRTKYGFNGTKRYYSHYHFYKRRQNDSNYTLPYQCKTCDYVKIKLNEKKFRTNNVSKWMHNGTVSIQAIKLWGYGSYLNPVLNNISKIVLRNQSGRITRNTIDAIPDTEYIICNETKSTITQNLSNSTVNNGTMQQSNWTVCRKEYYNRTYTAYDMDWECATPNITNNTEHKNKWWHYLRACKDCIAVQSVCESWDNFLNAMCLCDVSCGPGNEYKTGRCVPAPLSSDNEILYLYYGNGSKTDKKVCQPCPEFAAITGDFTIVSNCAINTIAIRALWGLLIIPGYLIMKKSVLHVKKLYGTRFVWMGYYGAIHYEEGRLIMNKLKNFNELVWKHDEGYFVCLCLMRTIILYWFVIIPKLITGEGSEVGINPMVTFFYSLVSGLNIWLGPEIVLLGLTYLIRTSIPKNYYKLHLIKLLHDELDQTYKWIRPILFTFSFIGPLVLNIYTAGFYFADVSIIPFRYQKQLAAIYKLYVQVYSTTTISTLTLVSIVSFGGIHIKWRHLTKLVVEDCYIDRKSVSSSRRLQMIESASSFEIKMMLYITFFLILLGIWYGMLTFSSSFRTYIAYGIPIMSLMTDFCIIYLINFACYGFPRRLNNANARRYIKVGDNIKGFEDNDELNQSGEVNIFSELKKSNTTVELNNSPAKLACFWYLPCFAPCRPKERVDPLLEMQDMNNAVEERTKKAFKAMGLEEKEIDKFFNLYRKMDKDNGGSIDIQEFYRHFNLSRSPFADRVFQVMDGDGSKELDFVEFVISLWNFCSLNRGGLMLFAFTLYDADDSGELEMEELHKLLSDVYGINGLQENPRVLSLVNQIDKSGDGSVQIHEFIYACKRYQLILKPAFSVQASLQNQTFGKRYWQDVTKKRQTSSMSTQDSLKDFMKEINFQRKS